MATPVVAILNMKGGVGKTTLSAHMNRVLFEAKRISILLIDLDPQYNLSQQLIKQSQYDKMSSAGKTALALFEPTPASDFFDVNTSKNDPPDPADVSTELFYLPGTNPRKNLSLIPGTFDLTKYSFIDDNSKLKHAKDYFKKFISQAKKHYDLIIIDMNPSSSFLTFAGLSVATDIVSPVRPDKFSLLGLNLVRKLVEHPQVDPTPNLHIVMNGVRRSATMTDTEQSIRVADFFKDRILTNKVYLSGVLAARSDYTGFATDRKVGNKKRIYNDLRLVGLELCGRMGL